MIGAAILLIKNKKIISIKFNEVNVREIQRDSLMGISRGCGAERIHAACIYARGRILAVKTIASLLLILIAI